MRWATVIILLGWFVSSAPAVLSAAPRESDAYHIVFAQRPVSAGERVELRLAPPVPEGVRLHWGIASGTMGYGIEQGIYRAPYVIPPGTPPVTVTAALSGPGIRTAVTAQIELLPSSIPGAADCLGPGQSFSPVLGTIEPGYTYSDELPELISRVEPDYPRSAFVRGIEDTIPISVLVCRSGRVLDAYALTSFLDLRDMVPVEHDPKLVEAALAAARQYVFKPALVQGQPIATWVHVPVSFRTSR